jgi:hypothetical protein
LGIQHFAMCTMYYAPCLQKMKLFFVENIGGVDGPPTWEDVAAYLVRIVHPKLFVQWKVQLAKKVVMVDVDHSWQWRKERSGPLILQSPIILGPQSHKNELWGTIDFVEDLVFYIYKGYWELSNAKNIWLINIMKK